MGLARLAIFYVKPGLTLQGKAHYVCVYPSTVQETDFLSKYLNDGDLQGVG